MTGLSYLILDLIIKAQISYYIYFLLHFVLCMFTFTTVYFHRYFRPTYENDSLLCHLADSDDNDDDKDDDDGADSQDMTVFQEDVPANIIANTVLTDKKLYKSLLMT